MKELHVFPDLILRLNAQSRNGSRTPIKVTTPGGHRVADDQTPDPIHDNCLHLQDTNGCVKETLEAMSDAIIKYDWIHFDTLVHKLVKLKPTGVKMTDFFREQVADAVARNAGALDLEEIRRKLREIGAKDTILDQGYEIGVQRVNQLQNKQRKRA